MEKHGTVMKIFIKAQALLDSTRQLDFLAPLALRLYLAPIFFTAGMNKFNSFPDTVQWFGDMMDGLGLPFPTLMAGLATGTELVGAAALLLGFGLRWMTLPMMFTMLIAIITVHWPNGWLAISEGMGPFATDRTMGAIERLSEAKDILMQHGDYDHITEFGPLVILNNGIEFAATYLIMLLSLFFTGAGRYVSVDYWIKRRIQSQM
jgi:uncharacterized membrane protein YphA (DoxX/SURF4 family)